MNYFSYIDKDLLLLIINKITNPIDHIRISGVSSLWRSVAKMARANLIRRIPGLVIFDSSGNYKIFKSIRYYCPYSLTSFKLDEFPVHHTIYGSHEGWLVLIKDDKSSLYLRNPFAKLSYDLPELGCDYENLNVCKVVLSSLPSIDPNCVVLILFDKLGVAFCSIKDKSWTKSGCFHGNYDGFSDALFFEGRFYLVDDYGKIYTLNHERRFLKEIQCQPCDLTKLSIRQKWYLVELRGELHRIQRKLSIDEGLYFDDGDDDDDDDEQCGGESGSLISTREFRVWKMDWSKKEWVRVWDLSGFALYLGCNNSLAISELEVFGMEGNRIYFGDDRHKTKHFGCIFPGQDMGVFSLRDSSINPICCTQCEWLKHPPPVWISALPW